MQADPREDTLRQRIADLEADLATRTAERDDAERRLFSLLRDPRVHRTASPSPSAPSDRPADDEAIPSRDGRPG